MGRIVIVIAESSGPFLALPSISQLTHHTLLSGKRTQMAWCIKAFQIPCNVSDCGPWRGLVELVELAGFAKNRPDPIVCHRFIIHLRLVFLRSVTTIHLMMSTDSGAGNVRPGYGVDMVGHASETSIRPADRVCYILSLVTRTSTQHKAMHL